MVSILSQIVEFRNGESGMHVRHIRTFTDMILRKLIQKTKRYDISFEDISKVLNQLFVSKEVNYYTKYDLSSYSICENLKIIIENGE